MTQGNYAVHIWLHKYIFFNNGGSKMDKEINVFGPVILDEGTQKGNDLPEYPMQSEESETDIT